MGWFGKTVTPYQSLVVGTINSAMAVDIRQAAPFAGLPLNTLEAVVAIFWMVERSLNGLEVSKREIAGRHAMDSLLEWFGGDYTPDEIRSLVIPVFMKRLEEYDGDFVVRPNESASAPMMRTFKRIVENAFGVDEPHIAQIAAALQLWWHPISEEGARIAALERDGRIAWNG